MDEEDKEKELSEEKEKNNLNEEIEKLTDDKDTTESFNYFNEEYLSSVHDLFAYVRKAIAEMRNNVFEGISSTIKVCSETVQNFDFSVVYENLVKTLEALKVPELSEDEKKELLEHHKEWGKLGWTYLPFSPPNFFDEAPKGIKEANSQMMAYCTDEEIEEIFKDLRKSSLKKSDLESAIFCYKNSQYRACAHILFSFIDSKLIRCQGTRTKKRDTGWNAIKKLNKKLNGKEEQILYETLYSANIIACLQEFFKTYPNFKNEPPLINRHFLMHGMTTRAVRKRDCIQLFLLLDNLLLLVDGD
ncbi:MAG: hypothetical protein ACI4IW_08135 [Oscillospiraceae bacterium]